MNQEPERYDADLDDLTQKGGAVAWTAIVFGLVMIGVLASCMSGCTWSPKFAPLITIQDSANGNTVPVSAVP